MNRIGIGFDAHQLVQGRKLLLGGVEIPHSKGLKGHSDADVLLHALTDALLGAAGLGDIGMHFPDSAPQWKNAASTIFVRKALEDVKKKGWEIENIDLILIAQEPRLGDYREKIRRSIATILEIRRSQVNLKATTTDHMGFIGRSEGIAAQVIVLLQKS
jgi:2-C-methyl-D-erythritol 2,4-cyclodiphosphate synthase